MPHCNTGAKKMMYGGKVKKMESGGVASSIKKSIRPKSRPDRSIKPKIRPDRSGETVKRANRLKQLIEKEAEGLRDKTPIKPIEKKDGGLVGGQYKLDKNKDGKISGEDFRMMEYGGAVKKMRYGGKVGGCRGGGAAVAGTKFSGCK